MHGNALYGVEFFRTALRKISGSRRGWGERVTGRQGQVNSEKKSALNRNELLVTPRCKSEDIIERNIK
jgi:hypothetical protein